VCNPEQVKIALAIKEIRTASTATPNPHSNHTYPGIKSKKSTGCPFNKILNTSEHFFTKESETLKIVISAFSKSLPNNETDS